MNTHEEQSRTENRNVTENVLNSKSFHSKGGKKGRTALGEVNSNSSRLTIKGKEVESTRISQPITRVRKEPGNETERPISKKRKIFNDNDDDKVHDDISIANSTKIAVDDIDSPWIELDELDKADPSMAPEYYNDIFTYFYKREVELSPKINYTLSKSKAGVHYIRPSVRAILIDWLVEVHEKFQCFPETLYLAINIMDRFLSENKVNTDRLQLLAVTALFIATKFEEIHLPKLAEYAYITDGAATKEDIKTAELYMLTRLDFEIAWPNPMNFLRRLSKADGYHTETRNIAKFILEYAFCSHHFIGKKPSYLSTIAFYLARRVVARNNILWNSTFTHYSGGIEALTDNEFQNDCITLITEIESPQTRLNSLRDKYDTGRSILKKVETYCNNMIQTKFSEVFQL